MSTTPDDELDRQAAAIIARIRRDLHLDEAQEVHVTRADTTPTDPRGPGELLRAWLRQRADHHTHRPTS